MIHFFLALLSNLSRWKCLTDIGTNGTDSGTRESRTDWHRCLVFGKLAHDFAGTLTKGTQVVVEGELRSREYDREVTVGAEKTTIT